MSEYSNVLKAIIADLGEDCANVSEEEYQLWKMNYENLPEHDKVFNLLGAMSQYLTCASKASASILATAVVCTERWCNEKDLENF